MSDLQRIADLQNQKSELEALINETIADGDVVGRLNFITRLEVVTAHLEGLKDGDARVGEVAILFDGAPVSGSHAIDAPFAAQEVTYFQSIVTRLYASSLRGERAQ